MHKLRQIQYEVVKRPYMVDRSLASVSLASAQCMLGFAPSPCHPERDATGSYGRATEIPG